MFNKCLQFLIKISIKLLSCGNLEVCDFVNFGFNLKEKIYFIFYFGI